MNIRIKQRIRALEMLRTAAPIMATLDDGQDNRWNQIVFVHPDDWEDAKRMYGDRLKNFFDEPEPKEG